MIWLVLKLVIKLREFQKIQNSEKFKNGHDKEMPKERYVSPEERQKIIDELMNWWG